MTISDKKVFITGHAKSYGKAIPYLGPLTCDRRDFFTNTKDFSLVLFTGGADVDPSFYNDTSPLHYCRYNTGRDTEEKEVFNHARKHNIKMVGICRGLQFLNVMCGGTLIHHLDNHECTEHSMSCSRDTKSYIINSLHHQMCIPPKNGLIIGWSTEKKSTLYVGKDDVAVNWAGPEVESVLMPDKQCCGVQYHPEMMQETAAGYMWFKDMVMAFLNMEIETFTSLFTGKKIHRYKNTV